MATIVTHKILRRFCQRRRWKRVNAWEPREMSIRPGFEVFIQLTITRMKRTYLTSDANTTLVNYFYTRRCQNTYAPSVYVTLLHQCHLSLCIVFKKSFQFCRCTITCVFNRSRFGMRGCQNNMIAKSYYYNSFFAFSKPLIF